MSERLPSDSQISHYRVLSKIGEGGMGEVYLAQDTKLDRKVALKILPADFGDDESRMSRFVREAKSVSALNHPNILTIHEIGEDSSQHYIATEFIAGKTLRALMQSGPLPLLQSIEIACQIGAALNAAHQAGIIHRDIKPENVMVRSDGLVKVLDFGLAKLSGGASDPESDTRLQSETQPGMIIGTVAYMSPQQARGKAVDARTDVWSLGVVIYEMMTGRQPFRGETMTDTLANIVHRDPEPLNIEAHDLSEILTKMLGKTVEARYPGINDVLSDLKRLQRQLEFEAELDRKSPSGRPTEAKTIIIPSTTIPEPISGTSMGSGSSRTDEGFWVAVLPFKFTGSNTEVATLAEGLSEEIVTGLSRFSYLRVIARSSALRFATETDDVRAVGKTLGARYVMEGSLRLVGSLLRVSVQLVDATTGTHLWAEKYERTFTPEALFALQDDLVPRIVSTVADWYGVLPHSMSETVRLKAPEQLSPYEALLRSFGYFERIATEEHGIVRSSLERAVAQEPGNADGWAMLSIMYGEEHRFGFNVEPDSLGRSLEAARHAVDVAHANHLAWLALAQALFFRKEFDTFRDAAERAIALNAMDGSTVEYLGHLIAFSGNWERGCELAERGRQLNPNHPSWYWSVPFLDAYRKGDYRSARPFLFKGNPQKVWLMQALLAALHGQLGELEAAAKPLREILMMRPDFPLIARDEFAKWYLPELVDHLMEGLSKAGLETIAQLPLSKSSPSLASNEIRADEGFWVAVLPFKFTGSNTEVATLAEGLSEEIVTGLSRFSYLRVISRGSTLRYANATDDVRAVGKTLGARYVMEGSLRLAGSMLRLAVQLVDASTGAHLWAETYDRPLRAENIFALQDDLVPRIVSTVADQYGALVHSMSELLRGRSAGQYSPHEAMLRAFGYWERMTPEEHAEVRDILEAAVAVAPDHSDCLAELAMIYWHEYAFGYNLKPDPVGRARAAAQRAVASAPTSHFAHCALATSLFFQKDYLAFRPAAERALALNRMDSSTAAILGNMIAYAGDWEYGLGIVERAMQLNPHHAGWYHYVAFCDAYRKHDYHNALAIVLKVNMPAYRWPHVYLAAVYGQLGEQQRATAALRELHALVPNFGAIAREEFGKWLDPELTEHLLEGLRKAGLEIDGGTGGNGDGETGGRGDAVKVRDVTPSPHLPVTPSPSGSLFKSIAVLPFQNLSVDPEQEFFADGITEEILNALAQIKELRVAGRSSSFSFKGRNEDLRSVGAKLNVTSILEGTLRRSGNRLRITAQLIDAVSGYQLWSERYDRVLEDIFDIQDEIALAVVDALKLTLFGDAKEAVVKRYTDDAEVHELFLKGRYYSYKYTAEGWTRAVEFFEKVIEKHPYHAPAHAGIAAAVGCLWFFGLSPADETVPTFRSAATKAIELDGNLAGAHLSLGMVNFFHDWEWEKAEQEFKQAILLNPKDAEALSYYAMFLGFVDRFDEAMALARRALEVDPLSLLINMNVGWTYFSAGLANEAFDQARKMTEIEPGFFGAYWLKGATCLGNGDYEEAIEQLTTAVSLGAHPIVLADLGAAYALAGKKETAETILDQLLDMRRQSYVPAICLARVYSRLGELEKTIQWLETAYEERNGELVFLESEITSAAKGDSLNSLGKDPRVMDLLERMKLPSREASRDQGE